MDGRIMSDFCRQLLIYNFREFHRSLYSLFSNRFALFVLTVARRSLNPLTFPKFILVSRVWLMEFLYTNVQLGDCWCAKMCRLGQLSWGVCFI